MSDYAKGMAKWQASDDAVFDEYTSWQIGLVRKHIGKRLLEIGAGTGRFTRYLSNSGGFKRYVALEPAVELYKELDASLDGSSVERIQCTSDALNCSFDGEFDTILLIHVLEHIKDDGGFLSSLDRFLAPGGKCIVMVPAHPWLMSKLDHNIGHYRRYEKGDFKRRLQLAHQMNLVELRHDNLLGVLGWLVLCKWGRMHYQTQGKKKALTQVFNIFSRFGLPVVRAVESILPRPIGLNLTAVLEKKLARE